MKFFLALSGNRVYHNVMPSNDVLFGTDDYRLITRTSKLTLQEQIAEIMKVKIKSGEYAPGDKLPSVRELADIFRVSRETAKLSLGTLKKEGYIEILPSRGGYVLELPPEQSSSIKTGTLGFVIDLGDAPQPQITVESIFENLLKHIDSHVQKWGNHLITSYIVYGEQSGKERFSSLLDKVDGLFVTGLINTDLLEELSSLSIPVVSLLSNIDVEKIDEVGVDGKKTYYKATKRLVDTGHKNIVYLDGPKEYYRELERIAGCMQAASEDPEGNAKIIEYHTDWWSPDSAHAGTIRLLSEYSDIDAIMGVNDVFAIGILRACQEKGFRVPEDISIVGGKNTILSISSTPQLSSIEYHFDEIGRIAVETMMNRIQIPEYHPVKTEMVGTLIERESTRKK